VIGDWGEGIDHRPITDRINGAEAFGSADALAEEVLLGLFHQVFAVLGVGQVEAVLVDDHGLELDPALPGFLGDVLEHALAEFAGQRRKVHAFGLAAEFHALHHTCHVLLLSL
jgi:hypothetical protein